MWSIITYLSEGLRTLFFYVNFLLRQMCSDVCT
jgi:hypothetical protein